MDARAGSPAGADPDRGIISNGDRACRSEFDHVLSDPRLHYEEWQADRRRPRHRSIRLRLRGKDLPETGQANSPEEEGGSRARVELREESLSPNRSLPSNFAQRMGELTAYVHGCGLVHSLVWLLKGTPNGP